MSQRKTLVDSAAAASGLCRCVGRDPGITVSEAEGIRIVWPQNKSGRAREVISRSGMRRRYIVPCFRGGDREAHCESEDERDAAVVLDACKGILFQEQPATITFKWRDEVVTHYPDLLVIDDICREFWECKRDDEAQDLYIRRRTEMLVALLLPLGYSYRLVTTSMLRKSFFIANAIVMRRRAKVGISDGLLDRMRELTKPVVAKRIFATHSRSSCGDEFSLLCAALYQGAVCADLAGPIGLEMKIWSSSEEDEPWLWQLLSKIS